MLELNQQSKHRWLFTILLGTRSLRVGLSNFQVPRGRTSGDCTPHGLCQRATGYQAVHCADARASLPHTALCTPLGNPHCGTAHLLLLYCVAVTSPMPHCKVHPYRHFPTALLRHAPSPHCCPMQVWSSLSSHAAQSLHTAWPPPPLPALLYPLGQGKEAAKDERGAGRLQLLLQLEQCGQLVARWEPSLNLNPHIVQPWLRSLVLPTIMNAAYISK